MQMVRVRKEKAGSSSLGHEWPEDGAIVEMPYHEAMDLLAIADSGCSVVDEPETVEEGPDPAAGGGEEPAVTVAVPGPAAEPQREEPEPEQPQAEEEPKPRRGGRRPAKATAAE